MKKCIILITLCLSGLLSACDHHPQNSEELLQQVRGYYLGLEACVGHSEITADYGQRVYNYEIDFSWRKEGETILTLTSPQNISGTTAHISADETALEFDGTILETGPLDASGLTPIDALPALLTYTHEGFVSACVIENTETDSLLHITCTNPKDSDSLNTEADLWFSANNYALLRGEISTNGQTIIYCTFSEFSTVTSE